VRKRKRHVQPVLLLLKEGVVIDSLPSPPPPLRRRRGNLDAMVRGQGKLFLLRLLGQDL